jgi:LPS-assembly lipoprotein
MSLRDRRHILALLVALPLAACGFSPVYGPGGSGGIVQDRVSFSEPNTQMEFALVSQLEDRIGRVSGAPYILDYEIETEQTELAVSENDDINRVNIFGRITYTVTEIATNRQVQAGEVSTFTAYATASSPVTTTAARSDAQERLMIALADQIVARLLSGAGTWQ